MTAPKPKAKNIERSRDTKDTGDDTLLRFEYQACYTAIKSLALLEADSPISYLYCEHHDDVLVKLTNNKYRALQVKTKRHGLFDSSHKQIVHALGKWVQLNTSWPDQIDLFVLATNTQFERCSGFRDLRFLRLAANQSPERSRSINTFYKEFNKEHNKKFSRAALCAVLARVEPEDNLPDLDSVMHELIAEISKCGYANHSYQTVSDAARTLKNTMRDKSVVAGRNHRSIFDEDPKVAIDDHIIEHKKVTREHVQAILNSILMSPSGTREKQSYSGEAGLPGLLRAFKAASRDLLDWPTTVGNDSWIERVEIENLLQTVISTESGVSILLGPKGSGKSALLSKLTRRLMASPVTVLALKADQINCDVKSTEELGDRLGLRGSVEGAFYVISQTRKVVLIVDQLDAIAELQDLKSERLNTVLDLLKKLRRRKNIHLILSSRKIDADYDTRLKSLDATRIELTQPSWESVCPILVKHGYAPSEIPQNFQEKLRSPHFLAAFLEQQE